MTRTTARTVPIFVTNGPQVDSAANAQHGLAMSRATSALAGRLAGNVVGHAWTPSLPLPTTDTGFDGNGVSLQLVAAISAVQTWTPCQWTDTTNVSVAEANTREGLPFRVTSGYIDIAAIVRLVTCDRCELAARLMLTDFVGDGVDKQYGNPSPAIVPREPVFWGNYALVGGKQHTYLGAMLHLSITGITLPASRRTTVGLQVMCTQDRSSSLDNGSYISVGVESLLIADRLEATE